MARGERRRGLTDAPQTLQFAWFVGHVTLLLTTIRYSLSYIFFNYYSKWAQFSYRTAFIAAAATYGIVVFKGYKARAKSGRQQGSPLALAGDENVQYLGEQIHGSPQDASSKLIIVQQWPSSGSTPSSILWRCSHMPSTASSTC
jgi:hypothetical protein